MKVSIREATRQDAAPLAELSEVLGYATRLDALQKRLNTLLEHPDHVVFVALANNRMAGWIHGFYTLRVESEPFVEIGGLVVNEAFRNKGIGRSLVATVAEWSQQHQCSKLRVRCNVIRKESHVFYEAIGFELQKEQYIFNKQLT